MEMISMVQIGGFLVIIEILCVTVTAQTNLALNGTVDQETTYTDDNGITHSANLAIEGPVNNNWDDGCSSTEPGNPTAWWALYLPEVAFITNIVIYYREDGAAQMNDFRLFVLNTSLSSPDEYRCYTDLGIAGLPDTTQDIDCYKLAQKVFFFNRGKVVELCYIEINGCWKGTWGTACTSDCPGECLDSHCFPENGSCVWSCDEQKCSHGKCDATSNVCTKGCEPGQGGRYCTFYNTVYNGIAKQSISSPSSPANVLIDGSTTSCISIVSTTSNSYIQIGNESLIVINGVYLFFGDRNPPAGIHKVYCSNTTDSWADGTVLYNAEYINEDIPVFAVCKYIIYIPPILNGNAQIDICEIEIGGCFYGKYGDSCQLLCPGNCIGPCDLNTGHCLFGCFDGWIGDRCDKACDEGKFGGQCLRKCSANCLSSLCDHVTGQCIAGCMKGWEGFNCTEECKKGNFGWNCSETCNGCIRNDCNHISGVCKNDNVCKPGYMHGRYCNQTCEAWQFGTNCNKTCNCLLDPCNPLTGECSDDICQIGWKGDSCDKECDRGSFGYNCIEFCDGCFNHSCNRFNGSCDTECKFGFSGPLCANKDTHTQESPAGSGAAIGGGISGAIIVIVIVVLAVIIYRRRSASPQDKNLSGNQSPRRSEGNTYFNHEIIQNKEEGYANMGSKTSVEDVHVSVTVQHPSNRRDSDENDQLPEEEEYEEEDERDLYTNEVSRQTKYKIPISDLKNIINEKRKDEGFNNEYKILPKGLVHAHDEGSKEENKLKNRFLRTWPYDHSRIVLTGNTKHDYINASYIDSYAKERTYIASQGPKKSTLRDFWHMIWQERVGKIVMVTKLEEERRKKCEQYWPQNVNRPMLVDNYKLTMKEEIQHTVYVYRLIILYNKTNKSEREVHHFHFTQWPDHGVPDITKLVKFYRKVRCDKQDISGPMVVHCSAGVGRTGTFIAVDALYEHGKKVGYVDIMEYVQMMRKDRMNMIQTHEQYAIVFEALLELFTVPDTSIEKNDFCEYIQKQENKTKNQTIYRKEFQRLRTLRQSYSSDKFSASNAKENKSKNSSTTVLAHDRYRPYLMSYGKTRSDYINAVIIPGYAVDSKMFVTQCPLVETVIDFWTMIYDHSSRIIVLLDSGNEGAPLWLETKEMLQFNDFRIIKETENAKEELQLTLNHTKNKEQISINVFTAEDWTVSNAPSSPEYMLDLLQRVQNCWETQTGPITVVCSDGCSKSGLFVALRLVLEKMQIDEEIDIFQVVREIQTRRPEFLSEFDQYEYCYKCIKELLKGDSCDSLYANI